MKRFGGFFREKAPVSSTSEDEPTQSDSHSSEVVSNQENINSIEDVPLEEIRQKVSELRDEIVNNAEGASALKLYIATDLLTDREIEDFNASSHTAEETWQKIQSIREEREFGGITTEIVDRRENPELAQKIASLELRGLDLKYGARPFSETSADGLEELKGQFDGFLSDSENQARYIRAAAAGKGSEDYEFASEFEEVRRQSDEAERELIRKEVQQRIDSGENPNDIYAELGPTERNVATGVLLENGGDAATLYQGLSPYDTIRYIDQIIDSGVSIAKIEDSIASKDRQFAEECLQILSNHGSGNPRGIMNRKGPQRVGMQNGRTVYN